MTRLLNNVRSSKFPQIFLLLTFSSLLPFPARISSEIKLVEAATTTIPRGATLTTKTSTDESSSTTASTLTASSSVTTPLPPLPPTIPTPRLRRDTPRVPASPPEVALEVDPPAPRAIPQQPRRRRRRMPRRRRMWEESEEEEEEDVILLAGRRRPAPPHPPPDYYRLRHRPVTPASPCISSPPVRT